MLRRFIGAVLPSMLAFAFSGLTRLWMAFLLGET